MNTAATIDPFMVAMISATVIASGTARWIWFDRDGDDREDEQRRTDHHVGADLLLDGCRIRMHAVAPRQA